MSYLVLARKYRPQTFEQVVAQSHITRTLTNAISSGRVAHAILFSGPRGTGKTTVARILAKAMNCKKGPTPSPCNTCRSCNEITAGNAVDVFEIDGASNNSVEQVRELRENIKYMPAHSSYKIYIIDEVHMLTTAAFNALLKTLEEPPAHVLFMFATTEAHKIPITILSRCQRYDFRRIDLNTIALHLGLLSRQEGFTIPEESLGLLAREAGGSMRDGLSLLDQIMTCAQETVSQEQVLDILGIVDRKVIFELSDAVLKSDIPGALSLLDEIYGRGHDMIKLYADLLEHFRNLLVAAMGKKIDRLVDLPPGEREQLAAQAGPTSPAVLKQILDSLFREEANIRRSPQPKLALEIALIRTLQTTPVLPIDVLIERLDTLRGEVFACGPAQESARGPSETHTPEKTPPPGSHRAASPDVGPNAVQNSGAEPEKSGAGSDPSENSTEAWERISAIVSKKNPSLAANLARCELVRSEEDCLEIEVPGNGFAMKMISREKNLGLLKQVCGDVFGRPKEIQLTPAVLEDANPQKKKSQDNLLKKKALGHPLVADAVEIFSGTLIDVKIL